MSCGFSRRIYNVIVIDIPYLYRPNIRLYILVAFNCLVLDAIFCSHLPSSHHFICTRQFIHLIISRRLVWLRLTLALFSPLLPYPHIIQHDHFISFYKVLMHDELEQDLHPADSKFPLFKSHAASSARSVTLNPGEVLYIPPFWLVRSEFPVLSVFLDVPSLSAELVS